MLFVRQSLEFASPLWSNALTQQNINKIERIQAQVTDLILGPNKFSYMERLRELDLSDLQRRRYVLAKNFCKKMIKDDRFKFLFPQRQSGTRSKKKYIEPLCKTNRMKHSAIPYFIQMLNNDCWTSSAQLSATWWQLQFIYFALIFCFLLDDGLHCET